MLFRRRNVAVAAVGEFDHHRLGQGTGRLDFESGQGVSLVRCCRDADVFAETDALHDDLGLLPFVKDDLLFRINLGLGFGQTVAHLRDDLLGPFETLFVRHAIVQNHPRFAHGDGGGALVVDAVDRLEGEGDHVRRVFFDGRTILAALWTLLVVMTPDVAAAAMRHHRDEAGLAGIELVLKPVGKQPEVIGADVLIAEVVHREIREQPDRLAVGGLHGDHLQHGILRTARAGDVVPIRRRVHVRPHREIAERILAHEFRMNDPAAQGGVVARIGLAPADFCGLQLRERCEDGLDQFLHEKGRIDRIRIRAETAHARRRGVGVRRRDEDASPRNTCLLRSDFLGLVEEVAPHHATVHNDDDDLFLAVGKRERARVDGRLDLVD